MAESAQTVTTRFNGRGKSTVCRAKSSDFSNVLERKVNLPDKHPHRRPLVQLHRRQDIFSLSDSVPISTLAMPSLWCATMHNAQNLTGLTTLRCARAVRRLNAP